jgi:hypothetical protein
MRKCINLEDQPGFQSIYAPKMQQAIDRGLAGHSGNPNNIDWGYDLPKPIEIPTIKGIAPTVKETPVYVPTDPNLPDPVIMGGDPYWDSLWNRYASQEARKLVNRFHSPKIIKGGFYSGSHNSYGAPWSVLETPYGYGGKDIQVLFHEYGHALDNIIGKSTGSVERDDSVGPSSRHIGRMETSLGMFGPMKADGLKTGLTFDDSIYWSFIEEHGVHLKGSRSISKGHSRESVEMRMHPGDHWRAMKQIVEDAKTNLARIKNTKNPDPVKLKRATVELAAIMTLYDLHTARHEKVAEIVTQLKKIEESMATSMPDFQAVGGDEMIGSITDIIAALTGDETMDKQLVDPIANGDIASIGSHGYGYFTQRLDHGGNISRGSFDDRNHSAMYGRRVEIWAELFQLWANTGGTTKNKEMYKFTKNLFPEMAKYLEQALAHAQTVKFSGSYYNENKDFVVV